MSDFKMNYGGIVDVKETPPFTYIEPGIHIVHLDTIAKVEVNTDKFIGTAADFIFKDEKGMSITKRLFPFKPTIGSDKSEDEQAKAYLQSIKHIFTKASSEEIFNKAMVNVKTFEDLINALYKIAVKSNGGKPFRLKVITNKEGYSTIPNYTGGIAESLDTNPSMLRFDPEKEGRKTVKSNTEKPSASSSGATDDLPF